MTDRRRRQKEQRAAKRTAERKRLARRELGRRLLTALGFGVVVITVLALTGTLGSRNGDLPAAYRTYRDQATACGAAAPPEMQPMTFSAPEPQSDLTGSVTATIVTSCGDVQIRLATGSSPETVESFVFLARQGFFDGQVFHRIVAGSVVQGGDPAADGTGGPGYRVPDEFPAEGFVYTPGTVAMANRGRGTTGSQFFIVMGDDASSLNPTFNVLGTVVGGWEALEAMGRVPTARRPESVEQSLPLETVYIETIRIEVADS